MVAQILEYAALIRGWILGDSGLALAASIRGAVPFEGIVSVKRPRANFADADAQLLWLADAANRSVTMVRPVLRPFAQAGG